MIEQPIDERGGFGRHDFLWRRLHSLSGIIPLGVFLVFHLATNASVLDSPETFQRRVDAIHGLGRFLVPVEILLIFVPIAFHAIVGLLLLRESRSNVMRYGYLANWRYLLQRITGVVAVVYIAYHVWHMHWLGRPLGGGLFDPHEAAGSAAAAMQQAYWGIPAAALYIVGNLCVVYHFANGIWTALITWGITIGPRAQRVSGYVCTAIGLLLATASVASVGWLVRAETGPGASPPVAESGGAGTARGL